MKIDHLKIRHDIASRSKVIASIIKNQKHQQILVLSIVSALKNLLIETAVICALFNKSFDRPPCYQNASLEMRLS